jgi:hypothetical protein
MPGRGDFYQTIIIEYDLRKKEFEKPENPSQFYSGDFL